jgi:hypothetical protein
MGSPRPHLYVARSQSATRYGDWNARAVGESAGSRPDSDSPSSTRATSLFMSLGEASTACREPPAQREVQDGRKVAHLQGRHRVRRVPRREVNGSLAPATVCASVH